MDDASPAASTGVCYEYGTIRACEGGGALTPARNGPCRRRGPARRSPRRRRQPGGAAVQATDRTAGGDMDRGTPPALTGWPTGRVLPLPPVRRCGQPAAARGWAARAGRAAARRRASGTAAAARAPSAAPPRAAPPSPGRPAGAAADRHGTPPPATAGSASQSRPAAAAGHQRQGATAQRGIGPGGIGPGGTGPGRARGRTRREGGRRRRTGRPCGAAGPRSAR